MVGIKVEVKEPIYCALAFGSASIDGRGYKPCCNIRPNSWKRNADDFNHANLIEIRNGQYIIFVV